MESSLLLTWPSTNAQAPIVCSAKYLPRLPGFTVEGPRKAWPGPVLSDLALPRVGNILHDTICELFLQICYFHPCFLG